MSLLNEILDLKVKAEMAGIPARRLYIGQVKGNQLQDELKGYKWFWQVGGPVKGQSVHGLDVQYSETPGMAIGE